MAVTGFSSNERDSKRKPGIGHNGGPPLDLTEIRQQLKQRGYNPLPNECKMPWPKGWNTPGYLIRELTDSANSRGRTALEKIEYWQWRYPGARSTGVRIENGLRVIDLDIGDASMAARMLDFIRELAPEIVARAPMRFGAPNKVALFCRVDETEEPGKYFTKEGNLSWVSETEFIRRGSHKYHRPEDAEDINHAVEIFGGKPWPSGNCSRQFGCYGPHSYNEDGTVKHEYRWADDRPALHEIDLKELPALSRKLGCEIVDAFDRLAEEAGWIKLKPPSQHQLGTSTLIYDIDENSRFNLNDGSVGVCYDDLVVTPFEEVRCSSSGDTGRNTTKCWVFNSPRHTCVAVYNHETGNTHYPKSMAGIDHVEFGKLLRGILANQAKQQAEKQTREDNELNRALDIWEQCQPLKGTPAERYLKACGIKLSKEARQVLRYHGAYPGRDGPMPALVALLTDIVTDEPIGVQLTALDPRTGSKLGCMVIGCSQGGAIKLTPVELIGHELAIGVGLEHALSMQQFGVTAPVWALCDIKALSQFPVLPRVPVIRWTVPSLGRIERLTIIASNDVDGGNQKAASQARANWEEHGLRVKVLTPRQGGCGFSDLLRARGP